MNKYLFLLLCFISVKTFSSESNYPLNYNSLSIDTIKEGIAQADSEQKESEPIVQRTVGRIDLTQKSAATALTDIKIPLIWYSESF
jgi:hypothetical protein